MSSGLLERGRGVRLAPMGLTILHNHQRWSLVTGLRNAAPHLGVSASRARRCGPRAGPTSPKPSRWQLIAAWNLRLHKTFRVGAWRTRISQQKAPPPAKRPRERRTDPSARPSPTTTTIPVQQPPTTAKMADRGTAAPRGGGFAARGDRGGARGDRGGDRGRGRGGRRGGRRGGGKNDEKEWQPVTKLGRLVKAGKIKSMEEIYLHSLPIKEYQIVDFFLPKLKDEVMKVRTPGFFLNAWQPVSNLQFLPPNRSSPSRSRPVPVSAPVSRPSSSLATPRATSVSASRPLRRSRPPSAPPSSSPSSASSLCAAVTGAPTSVSLTLCPPRRAASAVPSPSA